MGNFPIYMLYYCLMLLIQNKSGWVKKIFYPDLNWFCRCFFLWNVWFKGKSNLLGKSYWVFEVKLSYLVWMIWVNCFYFVCLNLSSKKCRGKSRIIWNFYCNTKPSKILFCFVLENAGATKTATFKLRHVFEFRV